MKILYIEPYEAGSHAAFTRTLTHGLDDLSWTCLTLPGRHWKWRMRGAAPYLALKHLETCLQPCDLLFASSYLALAELHGLVPQLAGVPSILYFHENQFAYPLRAAPGEEARPDYNFGFTQLVSALAATSVVFNSDHNRQSFFQGARDLLKRLPDAVPAGWVELVEAKSRVLHVPMTLPSDLGDELFIPKNPSPEGPVLLWNHRWEHDKNPEAFFDALFELDDRGAPFRLIVCGQRFRKAPPIFENARERLASHILHWGYAKSRETYFALLGQADIALSTAHHEFFGISMLEATHFGARPLVPDRLAYPELFPTEYRYPSDTALAGRLEAMIEAWSRGELALRADRRALTHGVLDSVLLPRYRALLEEVRGG